MQMASPTAQEDEPEKGEETEGRKRMGQKHEADRWTD